MLALPKTKAELELGENFAAVSGRLPGASWVERLRADAIGKFATLGLPHRRLEEWKYTDLRDRVKEAYAPALGAAREPKAADINAALGPFAAIPAARIVLVDGCFSPTFSSLGPLADQVEFKDLGGLLAKAPAWLAEKFAPARLGNDDPVEVLNRAFMTDGALIKVKPGVTLDRPVLVVNVRTSATPSAIATRNIVAVEAGAGIDLVEINVALPGAAAQAQWYGMTDIEVAAGARASHISIDLETGRATAVSTWRVRIGNGATYRAFQLTAGLALARRQGFVTFAGEGARLDYSGSFLAAGTQHVDTSLFIDHAVPGCESRELFKGVLADRARGIFQGKILVRQDAQKTDGKQMAQALMLSEDAEFDSKPELEIYADDVVCGHGSTCAEIDPDLLFYCASRGIPATEARAMLVRSFVGEAIDKVENEAVRHGLEAVADSWLARADGASLVNPGGTGS